MNSIEITSSNIKGLYVIRTKLFNDDRGSFRKVFNHDIFKANGICADFKEFYYSKSRKGTVRGMHFQIPPADCDKLIYLSKGTILDVSIDLRISSPTFGTVFSIPIDDSSGTALYLPKGVAHGFKALEDDSILNYAQTFCYSKEHDTGILYSSIDFDWQIENPIISERDLSFPSLSEFTKKNPFK